MRPIRAFCSFLISLVRNRYASRVVRIESGWANDLIITIEHDLGFEGTSGVCADGDVAQAQEARNDLACCGAWDINVRKLHTGDQGGFDYGGREPHDGVGARQA